MPHLSDPHPVIDSLIGPTDRRLPRWAWPCVFAAMLVAFLRLAAFHGIAPRGTDDQYYFAQVRSLVVDRDLDLRNELGTLTPRPENIHLSTTQPWHEPTATGKVSIKYAVGTAVVMTPFFVIAHVVTVSLRELGMPYTANGYELPYYLAWGLGNLVWAMVALIAARRLVVAIAGLAPWPSLVVTVTAFACSPLAYHTVGDPYMAHVPSAAMVAVVLLLALVPGAFSPRWRRFEPIVAGLAAGLAIAIRPTEVVWASCLLLPLLPANRLLAVPWREPRWGPGDLPILAFTGALGVLPQLLATKAVYGSFVHYTYGTEAFHAPAAYWFENLFSERSGLFAWNPLCLPALAMALCAGPLPWLVRVAAIGLVVWNSAWWCHWWGDTFGGRAHASLFAIAACGLGGLASRLHGVVERPQATARWAGRAVVLLLLLVAAAWTALLIWRMETMPAPDRASGLAMPYHFGPVGRTSSVPDHPEPTPTPFPSPTTASMSPPDLTAAGRSARDSARRAHRWPQRPPRRRFPGARGTRRCSNTGSAAAPSFGAPAEAAAKAEPGKK